MPPRATATHILFDMDGLLLDTEIIYTEITRKIIAPFGKTFDWNLKRHMIGRPAMDSARYLVEELQLPITAEEYLEARKGMAHTDFAACNPLPGAIELVQHLHRHRVPMAVATSSSRELFDLKTSRHRDWFALFDLVVCGDDPKITQGKPAPDIFNLAAERLGATPASTLVFEDSPQGLQAGLAAKMRVIAVPDPNMEKSHYPGADLIIDSLPEFAPENYGLPAIVDV